MSRLADVFAKALRRPSAGRPQRRPAVAASRSQTRRSQTSVVTVQVDDSPGWQGIHPAPGDRPWGDIYADLVDALDAWRKNFMVRRIVGLTRSYCVGAGLNVSSRDQNINDFILAFWSHPKNTIGRRLGEISDALCRDGELFPILFTNPVDGMSYLRFKSARQIREVVTDPEDFETVLSFTENTVAQAPRSWISPENPAAETVPLQPVMLHWAVNKPIDATRGESDLTPILPWALRYSEWLKDRVRLNRLRTRQGILDVEVADDTQVEAKRAQLRTSNPVDAGIYVHGPGEELAMHNLQIGADSAEEDGRVLRLAIATGAGLALHYLGEGEGTNYATAREMGEPTARFFADRQQRIIWFLHDLVGIAYRRYCLVTGQTAPEDLQLQTAVTEVARADNQTIANATLSIVRALAISAREGWIDDETALSIALKFAGETYPVEDIRQILARARSERDQDAEPPQEPDIPPDADTQPTQ